MMLDILIWGVYFIFLYYIVFWLLFLFDEGIIPNKRKLKSYPYVTIALPMFNEADNVEQTLESVFSLDYPKNKIKVICVNDGSTDNTLSILKKLNRKYNFELIDQINKGKFAALNSALKRTKSEYFVCLDADSIVVKDALKNMLADFTVNNVAAVMPLMKVYKPNNWILRFQHLEYMTNIFLKVMMQRQDAIPVAPGPFTVYKTQIIKKVGGFRRGNNVEDMEMAFRLQSHHYSLKQNIYSVVYTKSPSTFKEYYNQRLRWYSGTLLNCMDYKQLFFKKEFGDFSLIQLPMLLSAGFLTVIAVSIVYFFKLRNLYDQLEYFTLINFDFYTFFTKMHLSFDLYSFDMLFMLTSAVLIFIAIFVLRLSLKLNNERMDWKLSYILILFLFIYSSITAYIFLNVFMKIFLNKTDKWYK